MTLPMPAVGGKLDAEPSTIGPEARFNLPRGAIFGYHRASLRSDPWYHPGNVGRVEGNAPMSDEDDLDLASFSGADPARQMAAAT